MTIHVILAVIVKFCVAKNVSVYLTIIPEARFGYEMIDRQRGA